MRTRTPRRLTARPNASSRNWISIQASLLDWVETNPKAVKGCEASSGLRSRRAAIEPLFLDQFAGTGDLRVHPVRWSSSVVLQLAREVGSSLRNRQCSAKELQGRHA